MDIKKLVYFARIARDRSFGRAAANLGVTQSALTQAIARLEAELGVSLFNRDNNGVSLTAHGELLLPRAIWIAAEVNRVEAEMTLGRGAARPRIAVGIERSIGAVLVEDVLLQFLDDSPLVNLEVHESTSADLTDGLRRGEIDFVVLQSASDAQLNPQFITEPLVQLEENVVVGMNHPVAQLAAPSLLDLANHCWLLPFNVPGFAETVESVFREAQIEPPAQFLRTNSLDWGLRLIREGRVVTLSLKAILYSKLNSGEFKVLDMPEFRRSRQITICSLKRTNIAPAGRALMAAFRQALKVSFRGISTN